jgi:hypothetical protein
LKMRAAEPVFYRGFALISKKVRDPIRCSKTNH